MTNVRNYRTPALNGTDGADVPTWFDRLAQDVALEVQQFIGSGLGTVDLDTITKPGTYFQDFPGGLNGTQNYPKQQSGHLVVTAKSDASQVLQTYRAIGGETYTRSKGATWGAWTTVTVSVLGTADLDTILVPGRYHQDNAGSATSERHYPTFTTGVLTVHNSQGGGSSVVQEWMLLGTSSDYGITHRREKHGAGAWGAWLKTYPGDPLPTGSRAVVRDAGGRAKAADPAAADDLTTKAYVDALVAGAPLGAGEARREFSLYPATITLAKASADIPALGGTVVDMRTMTDVDRAKYFATPYNSTNGWLGNTVLDNDMGQGNTWIWGLTTDSQKIRIQGSHGLQKGNTIVLVDGVPADPGAFAVFPTYNGNASVILLEFKHKRTRTIELLNRFRFMTYEVETGSTYGPYKRDGRTVGLMGDSWIDGTTQALSAINYHLLTTQPWRLAVSANGGTGYTKDSAVGKKYTDPTRVGRMAAYAPDVCVLWGSINDNGVLAADLDTAARSVVDQLLAAKPTMKILMTSAQLPSAAQAAQLATLTAVADAYPTVTLHDAAAIHLANNVGPSDTGHPSPIGAKRLADWIAGLVNTALAT